MPAAGRGRRHLSLGGPATTVAPGARAPRSLGRLSHGPGAGAWGSAGPSPPTRALRRAAGPRPFPRSGPPAPSAQRLRPTGPVASGRVPNRRARGARSGAAEAPPPPQGRRSGPPRGGPALRVLTGPPRPPARPSSPSSPRRRRSRGSRGGRTGRWD